MRTFHAHEGGLHGSTILKRHSNIPEKVRSTHICHSRGSHQGVYLGRHAEIRIWGQYNSLEAGKDIITLTNSPYKTPTNLEEVENYVIGVKLMREDMAKLWSTEELLGWDKRELLVWHHIPSHFSFKSLLRASKRGIIPRNLSKIINLPPCCLHMWKIPQEAMEDQRQTLKRINQDTLGDQNWGYDLN